MTFSPRSLTVCSEIDFLMTVLAPGLLLKGELYLDLMPTLVVSEPMIVLLDVTFVEGRLVIGFKATNDVLLRVDPARCFAVRLENFLESLTGRVCLNLGFVRLTGVCCNTIWLVVLLNAGWLYCYSLEPI